MFLWYVALGILSVFDGCGGCLDRGMPQAVERVRGRDYIASPRLSVVYRPVPQAPCGRLGLTITACLRHLHSGAAGAAKHT